MYSKAFHSPICAILKLIIHRLYHFRQGNQKVPYLSSAPYRKARICKEPFYDVSNKSAKAPAIFSALYMASFTHPGVPNRNYEVPLPLYNNPLAFSPLL